MNVTICQPSHTHMHVRHDIQHTYGVYFILIQNLENGLWYELWPMPISIILTKKIMTLKCGHIFHIDCFGNAKEKSKYSMSIMIKKSRKNHYCISCCIYSLVNFDNLPE